VMGDGGFWHNGLATGAVNAQWNDYDAVLIIVDNGYAAATGQHHLPSTGTTPRGVPAQVSIEKTLKGIGVTWLRHIDSYSLTDAYRTIREALDARGKGLRVIISDNECMLARQRVERPAKEAARRSGMPVLDARFGVDEEVCTGDHSCMRFNGCPSLTLKQSSDPLKATPVAHVDQGCLACGHCGEVAHTAQLCPSFYKARGFANAAPWRKTVDRINRALLGALGAS
jgi:indolepyruvate ferredoxin oxidoreductase alpha subunit